MATTLDCSKANPVAWNPLNKEFWVCAGKDIVGVANTGYNKIDSIFNPPDISTPPIVTKAPNSATQVPYIVAQDDINATIADVWAQWKPNAIGANTPTQLDPGLFPDRGVSWLPLVVIGVGLLMAGRKI